MPQFYQARLKSHIERIASLLLLLCWISASHRVKWICSLHLVLLHLILLHLISHHIALHWHLLVCHKWIISSHTWLLLLLLHEWVHARSLTHGHLILHHGSLVLILHSLCHHVGHHVLLLVLHCVER